MKRVLITGFEPFDGKTLNPSELIVNKLNDEILAGAYVKSCLLPVVGDKSINKAIQAIEAYQPDVVIALGQASGRASITPEKVAINLDDYPIADNEGNIITDESIVDGGDTAYFSTLPIKAIVTKLNLLNIPAQVSYTAGTYICNHLFYGLLHHFKDTPIRCGFIHIPLMHEQNIANKTVSMSLNQMVEAIRIAITTSILQTEDLKTSSGTIC